MSWIKIAANDPQKKRKRIPAKSDVIEPSEIIEPGELGEKEGELEMSVMFVPQVGLNLMIERGKEMMLQELKKHENPSNWLIDDILDEIGTVLAMSVDKRDALKDPRVYKHVAAGKSIEDAIELAIIQEVRKDLSSLISGPPAPPSKVKRIPRK